MKVKHLLLIMIVGIGLLVWGIFHFNHITSSIKEVKGIIPSLIKTGNVPSSNPSYTSSAKGTTKHNPPQTDGSVAKLVYEKPTENPELMKRGNLIQNVVSINSELARLDKTDEGKYADTGTVTVKPPSKPYIIPSQDELQQQDIQDENQILYDDLNKNRQQALDSEKALRQNLKTYQKVLQTAYQTMPLDQVQAKNQQLEIVLKDCYQLNQLDENDQQLKKRLQTLLESKKNEDRTIAKNFFYREIKDNYTQIEKLLNEALAQLPKE